MAPAGVVPGVAGLIRVVVELAAGRGTPGRLVLFEHLEEAVDFLDAGFLELDFFAQVLDASLSIGLVGFGSLQYVSGLVSSILFRPRYGTDRQLRWGNRPSVRVSEP